MSTGQLRLNGVLLASLSDYCDSAAYTNPEHESKQQTIKSSKADTFASKLAPYLTGWQSCTQPSKPSCDRLLSADPEMYAAASCKIGDLEDGHSEVAPSSFSRFQGSARRILRMKPFVQSAMNSLAGSLNPSRTMPSLQSDVKSSGSFRQSTADISTGMTTPERPHTVNVDLAPLNPTQLCLVIHQETLDVVHLHIASSPPAPIAIENTSNLAGFLEAEDQGDLLIRDAFMQSNLTGFLEDKDQEDLLIRDAFMQSNLTGFLEDKDQEDLLIGDACLQFMDALKPDWRTEAFKKYRPVSHIFEAFKKHRPVSHIFEAFKKYRPVYHIFEAFKKHRPVSHISETFEKYRPVSHIFEAFKKHRPVSHIFEAFKKYRPVSHIFEAFKKYRPVSHIFEAFKKYMPVSHIFET
eukprot:gene29413-5762_t